MFSRRVFLQGGASGLLLGALARTGWPQVLKGPCAGFGTTPLRDRTRPVQTLNCPQRRVIIDGLPFNNWWTGDDYREDFPFHTCENCFGPGGPPAPTAEIDVAIVGGGISGLASAYMLRDYNTVLFEMRSRFGGVAMGEDWAGVRYSLGNAYVITPDAGSFLDTFYTELGLRDVVRVHDARDLVEFGGKLLPEFWTGAASSPEEQRAYHRYFQVVQEMAGSSYPDIPFAFDGSNDWILDLDRKSFKDDITERMGVPVPEALGHAIQAYCYSSFAEGWEQLSAASGWNFLAAEEYGRWVFPGGTSYMADALWQRLRANDGNPHRRLLRADSQVVDVRLAANDRVQVTYIDDQGKAASLLAKRVIMSCPKMLCKYIIHDLENIDEPRLNSMHSLEYNAYVVANVLLDAPVDLDFYDVFLLGKGLPTDSGEAAAASRVVDMLNGHYAETAAGHKAVLTLYWPLPFSTGRFTLITDDAWQNYAESIVPQIRSMLQLVGVSDRAVHEIRMTRWGHALPLAHRGLMAEGHIQRIREPLDGRIFFVNQDNWALPAVENSVLDAQIYTTAVAESL